MEIDYKKGLLFFERILNSIYITYHGDGKVNQIDVKGINRKMNVARNVLLDHIRELAISGRKNDLITYLDICYGEFTRLMESAEELSKLADAEPPLHVIFINHLMKLCIKLEMDYGNVISQEVNVPVWLKKIVFRQIAVKFSLIRFNLPREQMGDLLTNRILKFIKVEELDFEITRRSLHYKLEIIRRLEQWDWSQKIPHYSAMEQFLIYINFNSKEFMDILIGRIMQQISMEKDLPKKLFLLMDYHKTFNQLHRKPGLILNPGYHSLDRFVNNWFDNEIEYVQHCISLNNINPQVSSYKVSQVNVGKLLCNMSSDQLAIYLRLIDEEQLVKARSLNQVYQTLVPFLSTKHRINLSPSSVRVKSYHPEEHDKQKVIDVLERMIERVREY